MDILVIAQLVTGIATLVVASVLIWQMFIQKKTLDIAHNDADAQISLDSLKSRRDFLYKQLDNNDLKELFQNKKTYKDLNENEKQLLNKYLRPQFVQIITEFRLGRFDNSNVEPNIIWKALYKNTLLNSKLEQDFYKINRKWLLQEFHLNPFLAECADRAYEELTGEKIGY
tara:strand:- start:5331 stop:5843 length:513 start_codon:yes stop_codon:yes gene_type:complete